MQTRAESAAEYDLKAAFLYNFSVFVSWPTPPNPLNLCVYGDSPFGQTLDKLLAKKSNSRTNYQAFYFDKPSAVNTCHILFISRSHTETMDALLKKLATQPILTVTDLETNEPVASMINIHEQHGRLNFDINREALIKAGLNVHAKLLTLANEVR